MRYVKYTFYALALMVISLLIYVLYIIEEEQPYPVPPVAEQVKIDTKQLQQIDRQKQQVKEDLAFVMSKIKNVHPATLDGVPESVQRTYDHLIAQVNQTNRLLTNYDTYLYALRLLAELKDGHSIAGYPLVNNKKTLPIRVQWLGDELYVVDSADDRIQVKDRLVRIGGQSISQLLEDAKKLVPAESLYYVKAVVERRNMFVNELYLSTFGVVEQGAVEIDAERDGQIYSASLKLDYYSLHIAKTTLECWGYQIEAKDKLGILTINGCAADESYMQMLQSFFTEVKQKGIEHVVIDLRNNRGGNSRAGDMLLEYLPVAEYTGFGATVRHSVEVAAPGESRPPFGVTAFPSQELQNKRKQGLLFQGKLHVLTSKPTMSSAMWIATIIQDNQLGTRYRGADRRQAESLWRCDFIYDAAFEGEIPTVLQNI
ncbi:S41 family peptidase [Paenibacillus profundus]|uniref:S41 family peptidase n=1 Tax=Paenibacillus profundus TaxID=1173085 RepID=A0ABS8YA26_9BACL|nr:S41 family peptidase [Paenibacillus profundus]MCE5168197.1 S41 family peptidase [Paenibacillus profundus]